MPSPSVTTTLALEFLAPVAGAVAAGLAVPALLLLYFLKLRRRPVRVSSTLLWERAVTDLQVNAPFRMIRPSWLLLLQLLALAALVLAIARPAIDRPAETSRFVILIDVSASMNAADAPGPDGDAAPTTRLASAKQQARDVVDRIASGASAMVVAFAQDARPLTGFTRDRAILRRSIDELQHTDQPADLPQALRVVSALVRSNTVEAENDTEPPRVLLFSDGSFPRTAEPTTLAGAELQFIRTGPPPTVTGAAPASDEADAQATVDPGSANLGIVALAARRDLDDPAIVRIFVRLQSNDPAARQASLAAFVDGEPAAPASVTLEPVAPDPAQPPDRAEGGHTFTLDLPGDAVVTVALAADDALPADNRASIVLTPPRALDIALVRPAGPATAGAAALQDALETLDPRTLDIAPASDDGAYALPAGERGYDLIVFDRVRPDTAPPAPTISFAAPPGVPGLAVRDLAPDAPAAGPTRISYWRRTHPIMRDLALAEVVVARPMQLVLPASASLAGPDAPPATDDDADEPPAAASAPPVQTTVLAAGRSADLIVLAERGSLRRVVVAFRLDDTTWWRDISFPMFILNAVEHLTLAGATDAGVAWSTARSPIIPLAENAGVLVGPDDQRIPLTAGFDGAAAPGPIPTVGLWSVDGAAASAPDALAVNLASPHESLIRTADNVLVSGEDVQATSASAAAPQEIWHWFVLAAIILSMLEWFVFARRTKV